MSSFITPVLPASPFTHRIDGIDVSQLLRDIGEATACTDPIELFRLCLVAQCALVALDVPTSDEAALLTAFRTTDARGRKSILATAFFQAEYYAAHCLRPMLALVPSLRHVAGGAK